MRKTIDPIAYDLIVDCESNTLADVLELMRRGGVTSSDYKIKERGSQDYSLHFTSNIGPVLVGMVSQYSMRLQRLKSLKASHVFLMGPATIESLIDEAPSDYSYVSSGKFPFENCFFNFSKPELIKMPVTQKILPFHGFQLHQLDNGYLVQGYVDDILREGRVGFGGKQGCISHFQMVVVNPQQPRISFSFQDYSGPSAEKPISYIYENASGKVWYKPAPSLTEEAASMSVGKDIRWHIHEVDPRIKDPQIQLRSGTEAEFEPLNRFANLAVNVVNYINAHNVHVLSKKRQVRVRDPDMTGDTKVRTREYLTRIVTVKDGEMTLSDDEPSGSHQINYKYYVRGHNRHYRTPEREIRFTRWIKPQIRGPDDAPFFDQRHAVSAKKLLDEQKLIDSFRSK